MGTKTVLLVDDSPTVISLERLILCDQQLDFLSANAAQTALEIAAQNVPDLILMDIVMPGMDGIACCRLLKANPRTAKIPVIMVTTKGSQRMVQSAFEAGCDDYVTKPIEKVDLVCKIRKIFDRAEAPAQRMNP